MNDFLSPVKPTDQATVLEMVGAAMMMDVTVFNADNVIYMLDPEPPEYIVHDLICTISPTEGNFEQEPLGGGGEFVCIEQTGVLVAVWTRQMTDKVGEARHLLFGLDNDKTRALLILKRKILKSLTGRMLTDPQDGQPILTEHMLPLYSHVPRFGNWERQENMADLAIGFSTPFLWDLES